MRIKYNKTNWVDNETPVNAENMNKIETALENLYTLTLSLSDFATNSQIKPALTENGVYLNFDGIILREVFVRPSSSSSIGSPGDFYLESDDTSNYVLYFCIRSNFWLCFKCKSF